jgi:uncharacterized membrane protein
MCRYCKKPSSIPGFVETASTWVYAIAILFALMTFAFDVMKVARDTPASVTNPAVLLIGLLAFFVAVAAAKVFWVPLKALSENEVEKRQSTYGRIVTAMVIIMIAGTLLRKCGF